jgi:hypothetical protein
MKKTIFVAAFIGFFIALSIGASWFYIYNHGLSETASARRFAKWSAYAWPTSIMMMDADHLDFGTALLFLTSSILNAVIYASVGACLCFGWKRVFSGRVEQPL